MPLRNLLVLIGFLVTSLVCYGRAPHNRFSPMLDRAMKLVDQYYLEDVSQRQLFESAMQGMAAGLDEYSSYFVPESFQQVEEDLDQQFGGVGIKVELDEETKRLKVLSPLIATPAYQQGIRAGDLIMKIDGVSTEGMPLDESVKLMRGKPGDAVRMEILHPGDSEPVVLDVMRKKIHVESVLGDTRQKDGSWVYRVEEDPRVAYLRLVNFGQQSTEEVKQALQAMDEGVACQALVLDLRDNAGGLLVRAVEICDLFLRNGRIVSTRTRNNVVINEFDATTATEIPTDLPMVVLVNRFSASASEIVAACLQDNERALVIGERTWGKGTVQNIFKFEAGKSALKLTTASYWRPNGTNIHRRKDSPEEADWGVRPSPGYDLKLTDEDFKVVMQNRRDRDVVRTYLDEDGNVREIQPAEVDATDDLARDPHLRKAIEYLRGKIAPGE